MLLRFSVENFRSFKERAEFSLIPSKVSQHKNHVIAATKRSDIGALKTSIVYGANASGKSNLIKAMHHAQKLITDGKRVGQQLPHDPFLFDETSKVSPSRFEFEIKCHSANFAYGFVIDNHKVHEEWLFKIDRNADNALFEREENRFSLEMLKHKIPQQKHQDFLDFVSLGTPENRLFLLECYERNVFTQLPELSQLEEVFNWFKQTLNIIFPDSKYHGLEMAVHKNSNASDQLAGLLHALDTGIHKLALHTLDFEHDVDIPLELKTQIRDDLPPNEAALIANATQRYQIMKNEHGEISAHKLMSVHLNSTGNEVLLDLTQESDGTQRLLDIAPGLIDLLNKERVYVIDEVERSLHTDITTALLENFIASTQGSKSQLIITTHETNLLDLARIRRDEIWFTSKETSGASTLYSLEEYKPRFDKDVQKDYLSGRFGAIPNIKQREN